MYKIQNIELYQYEYEGWSFGTTPDKYDIQQSVNMGNIVSVLKVKAHAAHRLAPE